jgi:hypothetical protein
MLPSLSSLTIRHFSPPNRRIESGLVFQTNVPPRQQQKVCDLRSRAAGKARSENLDDLMLLGGMLPPVGSPSGRAAPSVPSLLVPADQLREEAGLGRPVEQKQKGPTGQTLPSPPVLNYADKVGDGNATTVSHSIYLKLKETSFVSEEVGRSVIVNSGGDLESSRVLFADNVAESLIEAEGGATVEVSRTEFSGNKVTGDGGIVVLDSESEPEQNEDNCAVNEGDGSGTGSCNGVIEDGVCGPFGENCIDREAEIPTYTPTAGPMIVSSNEPSSVICQFRSMTPRGNTNHPLKFDLHRAPEVKTASMSVAYLSLSDFFAKLSLFIPCFRLVFTKVTKRCLVYIHHIELFKNNASPCALGSGHHGFWGKNPNQLRAAPSSRRTIHHDIPSDTAAMISPAGLRRGGLVLFLDLGRGGLHIGHLLLELIDGIRRSGYSPMMATTMQV